MTLSNVNIQAEVQARFTVDVPAVTEVPGGLYPLHAAAFQIDEFRIMSGWPVPVPPHEIRTNVLVSCYGEILSTRDAPEQINTGAYIRWIADEQYFDPDALRWTPLQAGGTEWRSSVEYLPTLIEDYSYRLGDELFTHVSALNFDTDTRNHMWANFAASFGGGTGYTVVMVLSPNSVFGNDPAQPYSGLWCQGGPTPVGDTFTETVSDPYWANFTMQSHYLWMTTETRSAARGVSVNNPLSRTAPSYLAIVNTRPDVTIYVGTGPSNIQSKTLPTGTDVVPQNSGIVLGRSTGDVLHTMDMALFELSLYANPLTATEIRDEFALLSRAYGGDT